MRYFQIYRKLFKALSVKEKQSNNCIYLIYEMPQTLNLNGIAIKQLTGSVLYHSISAVYGGHFTLLTAVFADNITIVRVISDVK